MWHAGDVQYLVLDEADKMLSLGLQPQLDAIRAHVLPDTSAAPSKTQTGKRPKPVLPVPQVWTCSRYICLARGSNAAQSGGQAYSVPVLQERLLPYGLCSPY